MANFVTRFFTLHLRCGGRFAHFLGSRWEVFAWLFPWKAFLPKAAETPKVRALAAWHLAPCGGAFSGERVGGLCMGTFLGGTSAADVPAAEETGLAWHLRCAFFREWVGVLREHTAAARKRRKARD